MKPAKMTPQERGAATRKLAGLASKTPARKPAAPPAPKKGGRK